MRSEWVLSVWFLYLVVTINLTWFTFQGCWQGGHWATWLRQKEAKRTGQDAAREEPRPRPWPAHQGDWGLGTVTRVGAEKQGTKWDTGDRHEEGDSGMSPSYGATGACPALFVELLSFKSDNILLILILEWMSSLPIPSCNPLSEGLIRRCL